MKTLILEECKQVFSNVTCPFLNSVFKEQLKELENKLEETDLDIELAKLGNEGSKFRKDVRTPEKYLTDLYKGWFVEDCVFKLLEASMERHSNFEQLSIEKAGVDADRVVREGKITAEPDLKLSIGAYIASVDIKGSFTNLNFLNIKPYKTADKNSRITLYFLANSGKFFACNPVKSGKELTPCFRWGGKMTYEYTKQEFINDLVEPSQLLEELIKIV